MENLNALLKVSNEEIISLKNIQSELMINHRSNSNNSTKEESPKTNDLDLNYSINNNENYLQAKFEPCKQSMTDIKLALQKDLIDYGNYIKLNINKTKDITYQLVYQLQYALDEISSNYEVKLYGSRATQLCLIWSDLDVVITQKKHSKNQKNDNYSNDSMQQHHIHPYVILDLLSVALSPKLWVSSLKYISTAKVPVIKVTTTEKYSSMQIDISIQDSTHYGLKCVDLVNSYLNEYIVLEPLVLVIKTLLKLSSLNDPFTVLS